MDRSSPRASGRMTLAVQKTHAFIDKANENEKELRSRIDKLRRIEDVTRKWIDGRITGLASQIAMRSIANILAEGE